MYRPPLLVEHSAHCKVIASNHPCACRLRLARMGKITTSSIADVRVKVRRGTGAQACAAEMVGFLGCLDANASDESKCLKAKDALQACMESASKTANKWRHKAPINFHLKQVRCPSPHG
jgi:hypothetical protein